MTDDVDFGGNIMTSNEKILFAKQNLAMILNCDINIWDSNENVFIESQDIFFRINTFGKSTVMFADKQLLEWLFETFKSTPTQEILDTDNRYLINEKLRSMGKKLSGECMWYLHLLPEKMVEKPAGFTYRVFDQDTINEFYAAMKAQDAYKVLTHAVEEDNEYTLVMAAYDNDLIVAVAACEEYREIWDIGVDTLPEYRGHGLAGYLVKELALETEKRGKVAGYNTWSANIASTKVALNAGFYPVWLAHFCIDL